MNTDEHGFESEEESKNMKTKNRSIYFFSSVWLVAALAGGCASRPAAEAVAASAEISLANYQRNVGTLVEAFVADYRAASRAKADELADAAARAETGADGRANANNLRMIEAKRLEQYAKIEGTVTQMRGRLVTISADAANGLAYLAALRDSFRETTGTAEAMNAASEQLIALLESLAKKKN